MVGNADLAHVMHRRGVHYKLNFLLRQAYLTGDALAELAHMNDVHSGLIVLILGRAAQAPDDLNPRVVKLPGALPHLLLKLSGLIEQSEVRLHPGKNNVRAYRLGYVIDAA